MQAIVDLRSDTVTRPSPGMREAMANAVVGDDVLGDDPTVQELEARSASLLGKEAALFVPSGTMSNTVAITVHTRPGDEVLMDADAHSMLYEAGAPAAIAGVLVRQFHSSCGVPNVDEVARSIHHESLHTPRTALVVLENTHNVAGGAVIPLEVHERLYGICSSEGVRVHLDGARLFNAEAASGVCASRYAACADTVTFCLSKGLGCPVGSVLCGDRITIDRARRVRKMLGGGMRQSGVLAAAGLYALDHNRRRLADDHRRARRLAETLSELPNAEVDLASVQTNMVYFSTSAPADRWVTALAQRGVLCLALGVHRIRLVTHLDVDDEDVERAVRALKDVSAAVV